MANNKSQKRSVRADKKRYELNRWKKARIRTSNKKILAFLKEGKTEEYKTEYVSFMSLLDKAVKAHLIKNGKASRKKSRIALQINKAEKKAE